MINFHSKSYFVSLHLWRHAHAAVRGWISMTMMEMILGRRRMMMLRTTVYVMWTIPTQYHRGSSGQ